MNDLAEAGPSQSGGGDQTLFLHAWQTYDCGHLSVAAVNLSSGPGVSSRHFRKTITLETVFCPRVSRAK